MNEQNRPDSLCCSLQKLGHDVATQADLRTLWAFARLEHALGFPPSYRQVAKDLGVNVNAVLQKVKRLTACGLMTKAGTARTARPAARFSKT